MDALDLAIDDRFGVNHLSGLVTKPIHEPVFGLAFDMPELVTERRIVGQRPEPAEFIEVRDPAVADRLGDQAGQRAEERRFETGVSPFCRITR
jgi:hypothetical protein